MDDITITLEVEDPIVIEIDSVEEVNISLWGGCDD